MDRWERVFVQIYLSIVKFAGLHYKYSPKYIDWMVNINSNVTQQKLLCFSSLDVIICILFSTVWILNLCVIGNHLCGFRTGWKRWNAVKFCRMLSKKNKMKRTTWIASKTKKFSNVPSHQRSHSLFPFFVSSFHHFACNIFRYSFNVCAREFYFQINQEKSSNISHIKHYEFTYLLIRLM